MLVIGYLRSPYAPMVAAFRQDWRGSAMLRARNWPSNTAAARTIVYRRSLSIVVRCQWHTPGRQRLASEAATEAVPERSHDPREAS
jgi:hypothetical protein